MPGSVAVLKSALAVNVHPLPSLEHVTTSAVLSRAAAGGEAGVGSAIPAWHMSRNVGLFDP